MKYLSSLYAALAACAAANAANMPFDCVVEHMDLSAAASPQTVLASPSTGLASGTAAIAIEVDTAHPGQAMDGIGGAFNELGWDALLALPDNARQEVLRALFDPRTGAGLCFNRIPIGSSDFGKNAYSLDDTKDDYDLKDFSVQRDEGCLMQYIKAAHAFNPRMRFHASPWSPPGWMKTNGSQTGGGELKDDDRTLKAHAAYLVDFLKAYAAHGILVNRLCPQNEPLVAGNYPGCKISAALYAKMDGSYVIPAVRAAGLRTEVWAGNFNFYTGSTVPYFNELNANTDFIQSVAGVAFQYTDIDLVNEFRAKHPGTRLMFTESECYNGADSPQEASRDFQDFAAFTRAGAQLFTFWNMVLPEPRSSTWGWRQDSLVVIDKAKKTVTYEPSFALAKFLGRHVVPGARYVPSTVTSGDAGIGALHYPPGGGLGFYKTDLDKGAQAVAFLEPNGNTVVYLMNQGPQANAQVKLGGKTIDAVLPGASLCAIVVAR